MATAPVRIDIRDMLRAMSPEERRRLLSEVDPSPALPSLPPPLASEHVTCVMVIKSAYQVRPARQAAECFMRQAYAEKHLIVVNGVLPEGSRDDRVLVEVRPHTTEIYADPAMTFGAMFAQGARSAQGPWVLAWAFDEFSHIYRTAYQMAHRRDMAGVFLTRQMRVNIQSQTAFYHDDDAGIGGTALMTSGFACAMRDSDDALDALPQAMGGLRVATPNREWASRVSLGFYHGRNTATEAEWMALCQHRPGTCSLEAVDLEYVRHAAAAYGLTVTIGRPGQAPE